MEALIKKDLADLIKEMKKVWTDHLDLPILTRREFEDLADQNEHHDHG